jgi:hypothetical protein
VATSLLDVRDSFAPSATRVAECATADAGTARRRVPATVVAAGAVGVLEALGLLAVGLSSFDGLLTSPVRPAGWVIVLGLGLLAAWVVSCAGTAATLVDGAGRRSMTAVSFVELVAVAAFFVLATTTTVIPALPGHLTPAPVALLALAVPVGKLLLVGSPSAVAWVAAGPRIRERRPDPVAAHRLLCTLTIAGIGLALVAVAVFLPAPTASTGTDVASVVSGR